MSHTNMCAHTHNTQHTHTHAHARTHAHTHTHITSHHTTHVRARTLIWPTHTRAPAHAPACTLTQLPGDRERPDACGHGPRDHE